MRITEEGIISCSSHMGIDGTALGASIIFLKTHRNLIATCSNDSSEATFCWQAQQRSLGCPNNLLAENLVQFITANGATGASGLN